MHLAGIVTVGYDSLSSTGTEHCFHSEWYRCVLWTVLVRTYSEHDQYWYEMNLTEFRHIS